MKAITYTQYGSPDVMQLQEIPQPTPGDNQLLIKIHATAANPSDWRFLRASPFLARLEAGLFKPKNNILGFDIAGVVEAVGKNARQFKVGDAVFGDISTFAFSGGGFAEYAAVPEEAVILKPPALSFEQAAALPLAGITALQGLRDYGHLQNGEKVLINGASGGVGTFAVQIAKALGAEVTGVCSTRNLDLVRSLGADAVIDYTQADFTHSGQQYDLIFDMVGNRKIGDLKRVLRQDGRCVVGGFTTMGHLFHVMLVGAWVSRGSSQKFSQMPSAKANQPDLLFLKELAETGKITPVIDRTYPLEETPDAIRYLETSRARGKVVVMVGGTAG